MEWVDIFIIVVAVVSCVLGALSGVVRSVTRIVALLAGVYISFRHGDILAVHISWLLPPAGSAIGSYVAVFFIVYLPIYLAGELARRFLRITGLGAADILGGGLFGLARSAIIIVPLVLLLSLTPVAKSAAWRQSAALPVVGGFIKRVVDYFFSDTFIDGAIVYDEGGRPSLSFEKISESVVDKAKDLPASRRPPSLAAADAHNPNPAPGAATTPLPAASQKKSCDDVLGWIINLAIFDKSLSKNQLVALEAVKKRIENRGGLPDENDFNDLKKILGNREVC